MRLVASLCILAAGAAEDGSSTITISATRDPVAEALAGTAGAVSSIDRDAIAGGRTTTLRDVLGWVPGVLVQPRFGAEESRLAIRGSGLQRTFHLRGLRLLVDGQPINQADGGGDFQAVDLALADRISVYRGANALAYGAATLGGAIDIQTPTGFTAPALRLRAEGGSHGAAKVAADGGAVHGPVDVWVAASAWRSDGWRDHSRQESQRAAGTLGWRMTDLLRYRISGSYVASESELPGSLTPDQARAAPRQANPGSVLRDSKRDYPLWRVADRWEFGTADHHLHLGGGWTRKELEHPLAFGRVVQDSDDAVVQLRTVQRWASTHVVAGLDLARGDMDARTYAYAGPTGNARGALTAQADQTARSGAAYAELRQVLAGPWWIVGGAQAGQHRLDYVDRFTANGDQSGSRTWRFVNPKLGIIRDEDDQQWFANASASSEPPTFAEYIQADVAGPSRPQAGLQTQRAWTVEAGCRGETARLRWDLAIYHAWLRDEYLAQTISPGRAVTVNADRTTHTGIEAGCDALLGQALLLDDDALRLRQTWTWGRFRYDGDPTYGNRALPGLPEHSWRGGLQWSWHGWSAGCDAAWQAGWPMAADGSVAADDAWVWSVRSGWTGDGTRFFAEVFNVFDQPWTATSGIANPAQPAAQQALINPGDGLTVTVGGELTW
jgi:iron complex outermembrane recepter protein